MTHTYKAVQHYENSPFTLEKDGHHTICPKTAFLIPMQEQSKIAGTPPKTQFIPQQFPCNTACPFACISNKDWFEPTENGGSKSIGKKDVYKIGCESVTEVVLDEVVQYTKKGVIDMTPIRD